MELASARDLKSALKESVLAPLAANPAKLALSAGPLDRLAGPIRSIALGLAPAGANNYKLAVRYQRRELATSREMDVIRKQAKGEIDERYIGRAVKLAATPWPQRRHRPLRIGTSVGHFKVTAGTLGAFVTPRGGGGVHVLSNNHVLADENRGKVGDDILQPGVFDGGQQSEDAVATLTDKVLLRKNRTNLVDAAIAQLTDGTEYDPRSIQGAGKLKGVGPEFVDEGTAVRKLGRTTGLREGRISAIELDNVTVEFGLGVLRFDNQIEIEGTEPDGPFSQGGDSGSLIFDEDRRAVALLFAGTDVGGGNGLGLTFANPLRAVLDALGVDLLLE